MRKFLYAILLLAVVISAEGQTFEYIKIYTVQAGIEDKDKAKFVFPNHPDSSKVYNNLKLPDILLAVELMERKGFELFSITPAVQAVGIGGVIVTTAVMRRKKGS